MRTLSSAALDVRFAAREIEGAAAAVFWTGASWAGAYNALKIVEHLAVLGNATEGFKDIVLHQAIAEVAPCTAPQAEPPNDDAV